MNAEVVTQRELSQRPLTIKGEVVPARRGRPPADPLLKFIVTMGLIFVLEIAVTLVGALLGYWGNGTDGLSFAGIAVVAVILLLVLRAVVHKVRGRSRPASLVKG